MGCHLGLWRAASNAEGVKTLRAGQTEGQTEGRTDGRTEVSLFLVGERVGADPGVGDGDAGSDAEAGQVGGQGALQQVGGAAHGVLRLAHVQALGEEARVVCCPGGERESKMSPLLAAVHRGQKAKLSHKV